MDLVVDPVCGMQFSKEIAEAHSEYLSRTFYFCHPVYKKIFDVQPSRFVYGGTPNRAPRQPRSSQGTKPGIA
jgi:YHS domain-containing protein